MSGSLVWETGPRGPYPFPRVRQMADHRDSSPKILPLREQAQVVDGLLATRFSTLLPAVMRDTGFDMWLIICNEDHYDPVFRTIVPWSCWAPILQMVVFYDPGPGQEVERINISRTNMQGLMPESPWNPESEEDQWACLNRIVSERNPKRIGINHSSTIWAADGLTASLKERLVEALGPGTSDKLTPAEILCIRWLETRIPEELDLYQHANRIAHYLIAEVFSRNTITPGVTQIADLRWAYWQLANDLGLPVSFPPFFRRFRSPAHQRMWGEEDQTIRHGDILHCDVGVTYLRLTTDHQELAYVLHPDETEPLQGLQSAMVEGNHLQDVFTGSWEIGLSGNQILNRALSRAREAGISKPKIYSHSLGHYLHEPGPLMGLPWEQGSIPGRGDVVMHPNTCYTVELSVTRPVPEWENEEVTFMLEQNAAITTDGVVYIDGRQTQFHLI